MIPISKEKKGDKTFPQAILTLRKFKEEQHNSCLINNNDTYVQKFHIVHKQSARSSNRIRSNQYQGNHKGPSKYHYANESSQKDQVNCLKGAGKRESPVGYSFGVESDWL